MSDPSRPTRLDRRLYAWLAALGTLALLGARLWPGQVGPPLNLAEAYAAYAALAIWPAFAYLAARRLTRSAVLIGSLAALHLVWVLDVLPEVLARQPEASGPRLRVVTANLLAPSPSPAFARELLAMDADVLVLSELSTGWYELLDAEGVLARHPHARTEVIPATESYFGIGVLSRHPITDAVIEHVDHIPMIRADLDVDGHPLRVWAVHVHPPTSAGGLALWERHLSRVEELARADVEAARAVLVTGDFNTTTMTRAYRRLLGTGLGSAFDRAGVPFATTWPNGVFWFPPVRLDHVFVHGVRVESVRVGEGEGSDHRPIVTDVSLP